MVKGGADGRNADTVNSLILGDMKKRLQKTRFGFGRLGVSAKV
jgi:hypothetical protein